MKEGQDEEEEEGKKTTPMIKHDVNRHALLFLTLQLHWNPQITLMAGHEIWSAAHKMTQTYGDSTCSGMYQHPARVCARECVWAHACVHLCDCACSFPLMRRSTGGTEGFILSCVKV